MLRCTKPNNKNIDGVNHIMSSKSTIVLFIYLFFDRQTIENIFKIGDEPKSIQALF